MRNMQEDFRAINKWNEEEEIRRERREFKSSSAKLDENSKVQRDPMLQLFFTTN